MQVNITTTSIDDVTEITSPDWNGKIITLTRFSYEKWRSSNFTPETAAIYILSSNRYNEQGKKNTIYIGHTESADKRIENHTLNKDFWTAVFIFTSREDWMNIAFTKNIECKFIELAKIANRYTITNGNDGGSTHLGAEDLRKLDEFISKTKDILKIARIDFFEPYMNNVFTKEFKLGGGKNPKTCKLYITNINTEQKTLDIKVGSQIPIRKIYGESISCIDGVAIVGDFYEFKKETTIVYDDYTLLRIFDNIQLNDCVSENSYKLSDFIKNNS